jgi:ABC-type glycerol-3-phosphate transport system permease component
MSDAYRIFAGAITAVFLAALLFPVYWMVAGSVTPEAQLFESPSLVPRSVSFDHYRALFDEQNFLIPIRNSLVVAGATTAVAIPVAACCAYAVARLRMPGKAPLLALILAVSMFPQISIVLPLYLILR